MKLPAPLMAVTLYPRFPSHCTFSRYCCPPPYSRKRQRIAGRALRSLVCRFQLSLTFNSTFSSLTALRTGHTILKRACSSFEKSYSSKPCACPCSVKPSQQPWQRLQPLLSSVTTFAFLHAVQMMYCKVQKRRPCFLCQATEGVKTSPLAHLFAIPQCMQKCFTPLRRPKKRFADNCFVEKWYVFFHLKHS